MLVLISSVDNRRENQPTSNPTPPLPMTPFRPLTNSPVSPSSFSILLVQSSFLVHIITCSEYAAMVLSNGVLRSMSRSGGVEAHSQVGDGHVCVYGIIEACRRGDIVEKW